MLIIFFLDICFDAAVITMAVRLELVLVLVHLVAESQRTLDTKLQGWWKWLYCVIQWTLCAHSPGSGLGTGSTW